MPGDPSDRKRFRFILDALRDGFPEDWRNARILDLGCGHGDLEFFLGTVGCRHVRGVDLDAEAVREARERCQQFPHRFEVATVENTLSGIARGSWDAIICSEVLMHLAEPWQAVREMRRCLQHDGLLLVTIPNGYGPWETYHRLSERDRYRDLEGAPPGRLLVQRFTRGRFQQQMERCGFQLRGFRNSNFLCGVYPFNVLGYRSVDLLEKIDCWVADGLPAPLASGWYFAFSPRREVQRRRLSPLRRWRRSRRRPRAAAL